VRRRRAAVGKSAPLVMRDPSMLAHPQTPVTPTERGRFRKAAAFALFMSAVATLWVLAPALISWLAAQPLRWSALPVGSAHLVVDPRVLVITPPVAVIAFVCSFRRPHAPASHPSPRA
jgi:hypothetical protein